MPSQAALEAVAEDNLAGVAAKAQAHRDWLQQPAVQQQLLAANVYTSAFFLPKTTGTQAVVPTSEHLDAALQGGSIPPAMAAAVTKAAADFRFLHWHLAFPDVMQAGGFDCLLGNPPWEVSQLNEVEFFSSYRPELANLSGAARKQALAKLETEDPQAWNEYATAKRGFECSNEFYRAGRYPLCSQGKVNTYQLVRVQGS